MALCVDIYECLQVATRIVSYAHQISCLPSMEEAPSSSSCSVRRKSTLLLAFQSLGVIYGRLGTAPLYVFGSIHSKYFEPGSIETREFLSFIFWALTIISLLKYAVIVLRADNDGEGGTFALYSLLCRHARVGLLPNESSADEMRHSEVGSPSKTKAESKAKRAIEKHKSGHYLLLLLALFGCSMMIADAVLTPAISVLSASSGIVRALRDIKFMFSKKKDNQVDNVSVPSACAILVCLFTLQHCGSKRLGLMFAPVVIAWLLFIGVVGIYNISHYDPSIIKAISPVYIFGFFRKIDFNRWRALANIILCVAGSEAMFADLGHFSKNSIKVAFVSFVYPVLLLSYAGQAAFISHCVSRKDCPQHFNQLSASVPDPLHHVFIVLSILASSVASQATITGCFSIINQCLALGCFPRVKVVHTSDTIHGQVYIPDVNWLLMALSLILTISFRDPELIGYAAGTAIVSSMLVTTFLMSLVIALCWEKSLLQSTSFLVSFGSTELVFLSSCLLNFHKGAWFLIILTFLSLTIMLAWHYGTKRKYEHDLQNKVSIDWLADLSPKLGVSRVPGIGFVYTDIVTGVPNFFFHFITNLPAFHQVLIFVTFKAQPLPFVSPLRQYLVGRIGHREDRMFQCIVRYGYCDLIRDTDDFEEEIIRAIGEFISLEETGSESFASSEGRMIVVGRSCPEGALVPVGDTYSDIESDASPTNNEAQPGFLCKRSRDLIKKRKKVRFMLPEKCPKTRGESSRNELQELVDARESGTTYLIGQSHMKVARGSNLLKRLLVMIYVFIDRNGREPHVALRIPHAALVQVGTVYTI